MARSLLIGGGVATGISQTFDDDDSFSNNTASGQDNGDGGAFGVAMIFLALLVFVSVLCVPICCLLYFRRHPFLQSSAAAPTNAVASTGDSNATRPLQAPLPNDTNKKEDELAAIRLDMLKGRLDQADLKKVLQAQDFETEGLDEEKGGTKEAVAKEEPGEIHASVISIKDRSNHSSRQCCVRLTPTRTAPNCCAICLSGYKKEQTVVWSNNPSCRHAFHHECILDWLVKNPTSTRSILCPCCRQEFVDLQ